MIEIIAIFVQLFLSSISILNFIWYHIIEAVEMIISACEWCLTDRSVHCADRISFIYAKCTLIIFI